MFGDKKEKEFLQAVWSDDIPKISSMLEADKNLITKELIVADDRFWALHIAVAGGYEQMVSLLLEKGAAIDAQDKEGDTALHHAAAEGHERVARLLLEKGAAVNAQSKDGYTALHAAAEGHERVARLLLEKGAAVNAQSKDGYTALHAAARRGHERVARLLLEKGAAIDAQDKDGYTALYAAARRGHEQVVSLLLENGAAVNAQVIKCYLLPYAAERGYEQIVSLLLEKGANINAQDIDGTALHAAARRGHERVARLLLEKGANINAQDIVGNTVLHIAVARCNALIVELLLEQKGIFTHLENKDKQTPLALAEGIHKERQTEQSEAILTMLGQPGLLFGSSIKAVKKEKSGGTIAESQQEEASALKENRQGISGLSDSSSFTDNTELSLSALMGQFNGSIYQQTQGSEPLPAQGEQMMSKEQEKEEASDSEEGGVVHTPS